MALLYTTAHTHTQQPANIDSSSLSTNPATPDANIARVSRNTNSCVCVCLCHELYLSCLTAVKENKVVYGKSIVAFLFAAILVCDCCFLLLFISRYVIQLIVCCFERCLLSTEIQISPLSAISHTECPLASLTLPPGTRSP